MHSIIQQNKAFFLRNHLSKLIFKNNKHNFCINIESKNINITTDKSSTIQDEIKIENQENIKNLTEPKTRKEEVLFYIMHDKYSVRPDKEYRITHTTLESTDSKTKGKHSIKEIYTLKLIIKNTFISLDNYIKKKFYPRDYPYSVSNGYGEYSTYHFISNVLLNLMNFITIQVLINSMGINVSKSASFVFSAGMNWAIKEGIGQVGAILISTRFCQKISSNAKNYRVYWVAGVNIALLTECTSLIFPNYFLLLATSANFIKLTSLMASNISRTIILNQYAASQNISDITNKYSLQQNISVLVGNILGFSVSLLIPHTFGYTFSFLSVLAIANMMISIRSLRYINLNDFNFQRATLFCMEYINSNNKKLLSPIEVAKKESLFFRNFNNIKFCNTSPEIILKSDKTGYIIRIIDIFKDKNFIVYVKLKNFSILEKNKYKIYTFLKVNAENNDIFLAFLLTMKINSLLKEYKSNLYHKNISQVEDKANLWLEEIDKKYLFSELKNIGWNTNYNILEETYYRYHMLIKSV